MVQKGKILHLWDKLQRNPQQPLTWNMAFAEEKKCIEHKKQKQENTSLNSTTLFLVDKSILCTVCSFKALKSYFFSCKQDWAVCPVEEGIYNTGKFILPIFHRDYTYTGKNMWGWIISFSAQPQNQTHAQTECNHTHVLRVLLKLTLTLRCFFGSHSAS